jgi:hypothetical protein
MKIKHTLSHIMTFKGTDGGRLLRGVVQGSLSVSVMASTSITSDGLGETSGKISSSEGGSGLSIRLGRSNRSISGKG